MTVEYHHPDLPSGKGALISDCGAYRYLLTRFWENTEHRRARRRRHIMTFLMLNPSTADSNQDDPTIRKCVQFAHRNGCNGMHVVNLFAYRATDPRDLIEAAAAGVDIVGPENMKTIRHHFLAPGEGLNYGYFICAFGNLDKRLVEILLDKSRWPYIGALSKALHVEMLHLNKSGWPAHPLYQPYDRKLYRYVFPKQIRDKFWLPKAGHHG